MAQQVAEDEDTIVSLQDVLEEDQELENTANAVLGDSDDTECSYNKGYVDRQALYACGTCVSEADEPAGVCLACSLHCHEGHQLYELYTKRHFRCDCGNGNFRNFACTLNPEKDSSNPDNLYNHNFRGRYCTCNRPYPDTEDEVEDEMIQCIVCEDWFHSRHLQGEAPPSYEEMACNSCMKSHDFLYYYCLHTTPTPVTMETKPSSAESPLEVTNVSETSTKVEQTDTNESDSKTGMENVGTNDSETCSKQENEEGSSSCELSRRKALHLAHQSAAPSSEGKGAGYFDKDWRSQLCICSTCKGLYKTQQCLFLLDLTDSLPAYEKRAQKSLSSHDAAVVALGNMDRVQQVEAIHHYSELKTELSQFFNNFAQNKKVVSKRDIEDFFEDMQQRKRSRLDTGDGVPPASCHF